MTLISPVILLVNAAKKNMRLFDIGAYTVLGPAGGFTVISRIIHMSALKRWRGALVGSTDLLRFGGWAIIIMGVLRLIVE